MGKKILIWVINKLIMYYTKYQILSITEIIENLGNNIRGFNRVVVSENSQFNKLIYEISTQTNTFELIIELTVNDIEFKIGKNDFEVINPDIVLLTSIFTQLQEKKTLIKEYFIGVMRTNNF